MQTFEMPKRVVVDCKTWCRGTPGIDDTESALLTSDATRCCLGFACKQAGVADTALLGCAAPGGLNVYVTRLMTPLDSADSDSSEWAMNAMEINDEAGITDRERMQQLTAHWKKLGKDYSVKFINVPSDDNTKGKES
tara:strand:+ start:4762 stop:5172 length:411 start_codon:yes stop_codon:yes gene_type:complete